MKMSQLLQSITGLGGYAAIGMLIFFTFFIVMSIRTIRLDQSHLKEMSSMPLDPSDTRNKEGDQ
jgi:hypothetical protein